MANYTSKQELATRLLTKFGFLATIRAAATAGDPVTGSGGGAGATRTLYAVKVKPDERAFPETLINNSTAMLICDGPVEQDEFWIDGGNPRPILAVMDVEPDDTSHIVTKVLVGG